MQSNQLTKRIFLIRHGPTLDTEARRFSTRESDLTEEGVRKVKALAKKLAKYQFDEIVTGETVRTMRTAKILAGSEKNRKQRTKVKSKTERRTKVPKKPKIRVDGRFEDREFGPLQGKSKKRFRGLLDNPNLMPRGVEQRDKLDSRIYKAIVDCLLKTKNIAIVLHASGIKAVLRAFFCMDDVEINAFRSEPAGYYIFEINEGRMTLLNEKKQPVATSIVRLEL